MKSLTYFFYSCLLINTISAMDLATYLQPSVTEKSIKISLIHNLSKPITATCYEYNAAHEMTETQYPIASQTIVDISLQTKENTQITECLLHLPMTLPQNVFLTLYSKELNNGDIIHIKQQEQEIELYNISRQKIMAKLPITTKICCLGSLDHRNTLIRKIFLRNINIPEMSIHKNGQEQILRKDEIFQATMCNKNSYLLITIPNALQKLKIYNSVSIDIDEVLYFCLSSNSNITVFNKQLKHLGHLCTTDSFIEI